MLEQSEISRRTVLAGAAAGVTTVAVAGPAHAGGAHAGVVVPWLDQPAPVPPPAQNVVGNLLVWEDLDSRRTPNSEFFTVKHYDLPNLGAAGYRLTVDGLARHRRTLSLTALRRRPRRTVEFTLECSGNTGPPFFIGGIGNAHWTGTPLHLLLREAGPLDDATEVIFWGADRSPVTIRDNSGVPDPAGGLTITEQFARSMSLREAMDPGNLLCFEMNGKPLPREHGFPVRLIAPGQYGVANVKWLTRIQLVDQRYAGRFMARDYVTIRAPHPGQPVFRTPA